MSGIPDVSLALQVVRQLAKNATGQDKINLQRAAEVLFLASRITYFEAPDPTEEEAKQLGIKLNE